MLAPPLLDEILLSALREDLAGGDITTDALIDPDSWAFAEAVAKAPLVLSGTTPFARTFYAVGPGCRVEELVAEGTHVPAQTVLLRVEGRTKDLLRAERTALNFLQRLSGIATLTHKFVTQAAGQIRITDTRKTTPGLRALERNAVRHGGGHNHRDCLGSAVMIKDNHIAAVGGIRPAIELARARAPHTSRIEVEVTNLNELKEALSVGADIILLDNFEPEPLREAIDLAKGRALLEVSGGIVLERITELAGLGIDIVSVGALTHSAPAADISLRLTPISGGAPPPPAG